MARRTDGPPVVAVAITTSDTVDFTDGLAMGIHANATGTLVAVYEDDSAVPMYVVAGMRYGGQIKRVKTTGTDAGLQGAGNVCALYPKT